MKISITAEMDGGRGIVSRMSAAVKDVCVGSRATALGTQYGDIAIDITSIPCTIPPSICSGIEICTLANRRVGLGI